MENEVFKQNKGYSVDSDSSVAQPRTQPPLSSLTPFSGPRTQHPQGLTTAGNHGNDGYVYYGPGYLDSFPPGYRFCPRDDELVEHYLSRKLKSLPLPLNMIHEVNLYKENPDTLAEQYQAQGEKEWYFFTPRDKKYPNGKRPNRIARDGYWKATGADKPVKLNGRTHAYKKTLVFYEGKAQNGNKTPWIMQEFKVDTPSNSQRDQGDTRLDDWVLCKIYKKEHKQAGIRNQQRVDDGMSEDTEEPTIMRSSAEHSTAGTSGMDTDRYSGNMANNYNTCALGYCQLPQTTEVPDHSLGFQLDHMNSTLSLPTSEPQNELLLGLSSQDIEYLLTLFQPPNQPFG